MKKFARIAAIGLAFASLLFCTNSGQALDTEFHGRVQSTFVLRDTNGFQYGFLDESKGIQWRNELKFDITARPEYEEEHAFRLEKVFLSYRGAYDAIFDVCKDRDAWQDPAGDEAIREKATDDFDLGKDDIETENDLREAFVDLVGEVGTQSLTLRLGRQIVQWGEADGFNVVNVLNPNDNSVLMFFESPEDLATPLWMARLNYSAGDVGPLHDVGLEVVLIPDIRPMLFAPLHDTQYEDYNCNAPYAFGIQQLKDRRMPGLVGLAINDVGDVIPYLPSIADAVAADTTGALIGQMQGLIAANNLTPFYDQVMAGAFTGGQTFAASPVHINQVVPGNTIDNMEYGLRLQGGYGSFIGNLYYFHGFQDFPTFDLSRALTESTAYMVHPEQDIYGASFNVYLSSINAVLRGEGCMTNKMAFTDLTKVLESALFNYLGGYMATGEGLPGDNTSTVKYKVAESLIGLDKDLWIRWLNPSKMVGTSWQVYWRHIHEWEDDAIWRPWEKQDQYRLTGYFYTDYWHGRIHPEIFLMYDLRGVWMTMASVKYSRDGKLFYKLSQMSFWGNPGGATGSITPFTQPIDLTGTSEISFRVGYNW